jgi:hypothetical protein
MVTSLVHVPTIELVVGVVNDRLCPLLNSKPSLKTKDSLEEIFSPIQEAVYNQTVSYYASPELDDFVSGT